MPTWKETHAGTVYSEGAFDPQASGARITGVVYGLTDARTQLDVAINTAIAAVGYIHPDNSALPLVRATARWERGAPANDSLQAIARVTLDFELSRSAYADDATDFDNICDVQVDTVPWSTYESLPLACWESGGLGNGSYIAVGDTGTAVAANMLHNTKQATAKDAVPEVVDYVVDVPEWTIDVPITTTSSPVSWSSGLAGHINSATYTLGGYAFPVGTLKHVGIYTKVYKFDSGGGVTYQFRTTVRYKHRPFGFYKTWVDHYSAGFTKGQQTAKVCVRGQWNAPLAAFTDPPGV